METEKIILRGDTTVRNMNGDTITIAELEGKTNIIIGVAIRSLDNGEKQIRRTPVKIKVHYPITNYFNNTKTIDAFELSGNQCSLAVGRKGDHRFYNGDNDFEITSIKLDEAGMMIIDDFTIYRESDDIKRQPGRLFREEIEISRIKDIRSYYKVTFELIVDFGHLSGDLINVLVSDHFLLKRWGKN